MRYANASSLMYVRVGFPSMQALRWTLVRPESALPPERILVRLESALLSERVLVRPEAALRPESTLCDRSRLCATGVGFVRPESVLPLERALVQPESALPPERALERPESALVSNLELTLHVNCNLQRMVVAIVLRFRCLASPLPMAEHRRCHCRCCTRSRCCASSEALAEPMR
jgi:hypothetical protein